MGLSYGSGGVECVEIAILVKQSLSMSITIVATGCYSLVGVLEPVQCKTMYCYLCNVILCNHLYVLMNVLSYVNEESTKKKKTIMTCSISGQSSHNSDPAKLLRRHM